MVRLHVKRGDESQFLYDTTVLVPTYDLISEITKIYNGRLKIQRISQEMEELAKHGTFLPPNMLGLTDEQIEELKLVDEWGDICVPSGGFEVDKDPVGRRNGKRPKENMRQIIKKSVEEVKEAISKKQVDAGITITEKAIKEQLEILRGTCMIVYPMNLPPHDPIRMEFEDREELGGTQDSLQVISAEDAELWFCGKHLMPGQQLCDFIGKNEKTKVIIKIQKRGQGPPGREPIFSEEQRKELVMHAYKRQQDMKRLEEEDDDNYLNSEWADNSSLKRSFHGLQNVSWKPK